MSLNKNPYKRFRIIDNCLRRMYFPAKDEILNKLEDEGYRVTDSMFEKDLFAMKNMFSLDIRYDRLNKGYYYADAEARLDVALTDEEIELVWMAIQKNLQLADSVKIRNVNQSLERLMTRMGINLEEKRSRLEGILDFGTRTDQMLTGNLSKLFDAIVDQRTVVLQLPTVDPSGEVTLQPYCLRQILKKWYVSGMAKGSLKKFQILPETGIVLTNNHFVPDNTLYDKIKTIGF